MLTASMLIGQVLDDQPPDHIGHSSPTPRPMGPAGPVSSACTGTSGFVLSHADGFLPYAFERMALTIARDGACRPRKWWSSSGPSTSTPRCRPARRPCPQCWPSRGPATWCSAPTGPSRRSRWWTPSPQACTSTPVSTRRCDERRPEQCRRAVLVVTTVPPGRARNTTTRSWPTSTAGAATDGATAGCRRRRPGPTPTAADRPLLAQRAASIRHGASGQPDECRGCPDVPKGPSAAAFRVREHYMRRRGRGSVGNADSRLCAAERPGPGHAPRYSRGAKAHRAVRDRGLRTCGTEDRRDGR